MLRQFVRRIHYSQRFYEAQVELTSVRYAGVKRGNYAQLSEKHVQQFERILPKERVLTDPSDVQSYNVDWLRMVRGASQVVLRPKTTEEVSAILQYCNEECLAVCPQGGNTGLVGGSVPVFDEVILSTSLMNNIIGLDELSGVLTCQAGCVLENLETYLSERGFMMPLDLGAKGTCQIGGNVSTNAGGIRLIRYGSLQGSILGVEAVKADGEVIDCLNSLKKDNTGYHLKHLFIGSEGTLGIVTKIAVHCPPSPKAVNVAFLGLEKFEDVLQTFQNARRDLGEILSSCEMMDRLSLDAAVTNLKLKQPIGDFPFYMLIETSGSNGIHDEEKLTSFLDNSLETGVVLDGTVASEPSKIKMFWSLREGVTEGLLQDGYVFKYDISLPHANFYSIVPELQARLSLNQVKRVCGYGHVGDGNLHLNITVPQYDSEVMKIVEPFVFEWTSKLKGSVSAEHGIGFKKTQYIHFSKSQSSLNLMTNIKQLMDPKGILNPYKVLPADH
ncbi:hypothetical protein L9F63_009615 [Diploptera punctata]|uniref:D-2-hydroxyglutarate dehydrogenase, mitochondrial n=1 Tax=Diploptera punctata TaxID=6984 RepID=A0AAD8ES59_DIPPU|nr:hypothetical protein L9F63_009615 [Diploptera punctata]